MGIRSEISEAHFQKILGIAKDTWNFGVYGESRVKMVAAWYLVNPNEFIDYQHFNGNEILFMSARMDSNVKIVTCYCGAVAIQI